MSTTNEAQQARPSCFANHHMTVSEYGFYQLIRSLSGESGILYFNGPRLAERFVAMSKSHPYKLAKALQEKGWLELLVEKRRRRDSKKYTPRHYRVLSHEEWGLKHPNACHEIEGEPLPIRVMDETEPLPIRVKAIPSTGNPVPSTGNKVSAEGSNLLKPLSQPPYKPLPAYTNKEPLPKSGMVFQGQDGAPAGTGSAPPVSDLGLVIPHPHLGQDSSPQAGTSSAPNPLSNSGTVTVQNTHERPNLYFDNDGVQRDKDTHRELSGPEVTRRFALAGLRREGIEFYETGSGVLVPFKEARSRIEGREAR